VVVIWLALALVALIGAGLLVDRLTRRGQNLDGHETGVFSAELLDELRGLPPGWDGLDGQPVGPGALLVLARLIEVAPMPSGGVQIVIQMQGGSSVVVELTPGGYLDSSSVLGDLTTQIERN